MITITEFKRHCATVDTANKYFLKYQNDILSSNEFQFTILLCAFYHDDIKIVELLLGHGIDPNVQYRNRPIILEYLCTTKNINMDMIKLLLGYGMNLNEKYYDYGTIFGLICNILNINVNVIKLLLDHGADPNIVVDNIPIFVRLCMVKDININIIKLLLDHGANYNLIFGRFKDFLTSRLNFNVFELLFSEYNVDPNMMIALPTNSHFGEKYKLKSLLHLIIEYKEKDDNYDVETQYYVDFIKMLLDCGADPNIKDEDHCTPLHIANNLTIIKLLVEAKADINAQDKWGRTPLMCIYKNVGAAKYLLEQGADANMINNHGQNALMIFAHDYIGIDIEIIELINIMIQETHNINLQDNDGNTALMLFTRELYATDYCDTNVKKAYKLFFENGANIHIKNNCEDIASKMINHRTPEGTELANFIETYKIDRINNKLIKKNKRLKKENEELKKENEKLKIELAYIPGHAGYYAAMEDFQNKCCQNFELKDMSD